MYTYQIEMGTEGWPVEVEVLGVTSNRNTGRVTSKCLDEYRNRRKVGPGGGFKTRVEKKKRGQLYDRGDLCENKYVYPGGEKPRGVLKKLSFHTHTNPMPGLANIYEQAFKKQRKDGSSWGCLGPSARERDDDVDPSAGKGKGPPKRAYPMVLFQLRRQKGPKGRMSYENSFESTRGNHGEDVCEKNNST